MFKPCSLGVLPRSQLLCHPLLPHGRKGLERPGRLGEQSKDLFLRERLEDMLDQLSPEPQVILPLDTVQSLSQKTGSVVVNVYLRKERE